MLDKLRSMLMARMERATSRLADLDEPAIELDSVRAKANAFLQEGKYDQAEQSYRQLLSKSPNDVKALVSLGFTLKEQRRLVEARVYLKRAIALRADDILPHETHFFFGQIAEEQGHLEEAAQHYTIALELQPDFSFASRDLCRALFYLGKYVGAQTALDQGLKLHPEFADFHFYQGNLQVVHENHDLAAKSYAEALRLGAVHADVYAAMGAAQYRLGNETVALENFRIAVSKDPTVEAEAHYHAGTFSMRSGDYSNAISSFELAIALRPDYTNVHSSLLFCLSINPSGPPTYQQAAQRYGALLTGQANGATRPARPAYTRGQRPLTIGFVSGDFKKHPVGYFLEGILREIDPARIQLIAYSNTSNVDQVTDRLRPLFAQWHEITGLTDAAAVQLIQSHKVDILVDLGGHTGDKRLPIFARRPAPIQVTWLGYFASTGVTEIDYILVDEVSVPKGSKEFFNENIWYLPDTRLCMTPPVTQVEIPVTPPPAVSAGHVTFGCYQGSTKINDGVLSVWSRVLAALPDAKLRLRVKLAQIPALRNDFLAQMARAGIDVNRVSLLPALHWEEYLADYQNVDILLDTFPFPGGTTTADALWMGVPTITLLGNTMLSRQGASMLSCVGLEDWIADGEDEYVAKACRFASDIPGLAQLRATLRDRAIQSPLFDTRRFALNLQNCFEEMYLS